jgi:NADPH:quinone reductase
MTGFGGPEVLRLDEIATPALGPGQVLIRVAVAAVTYGDVMKRQGRFGTHIPLPAGLGQQVAGTVVQVGPGVSRPAPGVRVAALVEHGYAEYAIAPAGLVAPLPDEVDLRSAATVWIQGMTAYQALRDVCGLRPGEAVLVHAAAGGVGSWAVQLATLLGASVVVGTAGGQRKTEHARALGADVVIDYTNSGWAEAVLDATDGGGVDVALESVGGDVAEQTLRCMAPFGRIASFGAAAGTPATFAGMSLMENNLSVTGYSLMGWLDRSDHVADAVEQLVGYLARSELRVPIGAVHTLAEVRQAHRALEERGNLGGTLLRPGLP